MPVSLISAFFVLYWHRFFFIDPSKLPEKERGEEVKQEKVFSALTVSKSTLYPDTISHSTVKKDEKKVQKKNTEQYTCVR
jgi:hypothetical protein